MTEATVPNYASEQTTDTIHVRMLGAVRPGLDLSEGGFVWDATRPAAILLRVANVNQIEWLRRAFVRDAFGVWLDLRAEEHGLVRLPATQATGSVRFTGSNTTIIPAATLVSTVGTTQEPSIIFATTSQVTIPISGTVDAAVIATSSGVNGNVPTGTIIRMQSPVTGVTAVTNVIPTVGGADLESDENLKERYYLKVRTPSAGGNAADYLNWSLEVPGVGGAAVVPIRDGPGTVSVAIVDADALPASQSLVDVVQNYIAPPHRQQYEDETLTITGASGVTTATGQTDASGGRALQMVYNVAGNGTLELSDVNTLLPQAGIWQARFRVKVNSVVATTDLLNVQVYNNSTAAIAKTRPAGSADATKTLGADELSTVYGDTTAMVEFYWNGTDSLDARLARLTTDTTTTVLVDMLTLRSTFSQDDGSGKAPIGARVWVESAVAVPITIAVELEIEPGYDPTAVEEKVEDNLVAYLQEIALQSDNDVRYVRIANVIFDTEGVSDYASLTVNGGLTTVAIGPQAVGVLVTPVTFL
jgi:uncharacterized phage protein gp47/JayE